MTRPRLAMMFVLWGGGIGGAERHTFDLCRAIERLRLAHTRILLVGSIPEASQAQIKRGVRIGTLGMRRGRDVLAHPRCVGRALRQAGCDVVYSSTGWIGTAAIRAGGYGGPLIVQEHGSLLNPGAYPLWHRPFSIMGGRVAVRTADACMAVSPVMAEEVTRLLKPHDRVVVIPNGVDITAYRPLARSLDRSVFVAGTASRLIRGKGIDEAIRALHAVDEDGMELQIAGDGPDLDRLRALAAAGPARERIRFLGALQDMPSFWRGCDVAVHATNGLRESYCMSVAEAQACGIPAVVSSAGALPWLVADGATGTVVRPGSVAELASALHSYFVDAKKRKRHGEAARRRVVSRFAMDNAAERYVRLAESIAEGVT